MSTGIVEPPKKEVAAAKKPATLKDLIQGDAFKQAVSSALPKHLTADRFCRVAATALMRVPKLAQCDQASFFNCLLTLSQYGLEPDGRNAHLIPFENRRAGITECQLIIDYKGLVELAMRSGLIARIHADVVCINDVFEYNMGNITEHKIDLKNDRGEVYAAYAIVTFKDGTSKCEVMSFREIEAIRNRSRSGSNGPWVTDWKEMAKKSCFRRLSKWISISAEFRDAIDADDDVIETTAVNQPKTRIADLVIDTELLPEPPVETLAIEQQSEEPTKPVETPKAEQKTAATKQQKQIVASEPTIAEIKGCKTMAELNKLALEIDNIADQNKRATLLEAAADRQNAIDAQG